MPRKLKLNPQQGDILWMLEETNAEELPTIVVTIEPPDIQVFEDDVRELLRLGLIDYYRDLDRQDLRYLALTQSEIDDLPGFQKILDQYDPKKMEGIMLTKAGTIALRT